jgi:hypothetical protein
MHAEVEPVTRLMYPREGANLRVYPGKIPLLIAFVARDGREAK